MATLKDSIVTELIKEIALLRKWANQSLKGGWSTHQVEPMRRRADELEQLLMNGD